MQVLQLWGLAGSLDPSTSAGDEGVSAGTRKRKAAAVELTGGHRPATDGGGVHTFQRIKDRHAPSETAEPRSELRVC